MTSNREAPVLSSELTDQLAELIYDTQHDACVDGCSGGGRLWYDRVAARLTDPVGPLAEIADEREAQDDKWGEQNHPDGTGPVIRLLDGGRWSSEHVAAVFANRCKANAERGFPTWRDILLARVFGAMAETDPGKLRTELVQVAAVATAWIEAIDRRTEKASADAAALDFRPNPTGSGS